MNYPVVGYEKVVLKSSIVFIAQDTGEYGTSGVMAVIGDFL